MTDDKPTPERLAELAEADRKWPPERNFEYLRTLVDEAEAAAYHKDADKLASRVAELQGALAGVKSWPWYEQEAMQGVESDE